MNRGRKIAAMACQNEENTYIKSNTNISLSYVENWIDAGNGIETDMNRFNDEFGINNYFTVRKTSHFGELVENNISLNDTGDENEIYMDQLNCICIDDYTVVVDTSHFDELVTNNTTLNSNNIDITKQLKNIFDVTENNHVLCDTYENNITLNGGNKCSVMTVNNQSNITSEVIDDPVLLESNIDVQNTFENSLDEELNKINNGSIHRQRQVKYQSQKNRLFGKEYIGYKMVNGKHFQNVPKEKRTIKERCNHLLINQKSSNSFMCGSFSDGDRKNAFKLFWKMKTWEEKRGFIRGLVTNRPIMRRRKINKSDKAKKIESRDIRLCLTNGQKLKVCRNFF